MATQPIDFSDLGGKVVQPAQGQSAGIDFSDLGGRVVQSAQAPAQPAAPSEEYGSTGFEGYTPQNPIETYTQALPVAGGALGGFGGPAGVAVGTGVGRLAQQAINARYGFESVPSTPLGAAADVGVSMAAAGGLAKAGQMLPGVVNRVLPSALKQRAGQLFESVAQDANNVPVSLDNSQQAAAKLLDFQGVKNLGPTVNKFLQRVTKPNAPPLTYREARLFYTELGDLSWGEKFTTSPNVLRAMRNLTFGLKQDIGNAAEEVGRASDYYQAMGDYARAQTLKKAYITLAGSTGVWAAKKYHALTSLGDLLTK